MSVRSICHLFSNVFVQVTGINVDFSVISLVENNNSLKKEREEIVSFHFLKGQGRYL